tara:strand:+ start:2427 stop:3983 length:1557 start_codon:yes stop_codon:yes gene_type:complete
MITSTSTVLEDFEFLDSLGDQGFDIQNAQIPNLLEKYGTIDNFKEAYRTAKKQNKKIDSNLPLTEMLEEAQTGDASLGERIAQERGISVPEGTKSGSKITEEVVPSEIYKEKEKPIEIFGVDTGETYTGKTPIESGLDAVGTYLDNKLKYNYSDPEIMMRKSDTGDAKLGEMDDLEAYKRGMITDKGDLRAGDQFKAGIYDAQLMKDYSDRAKAMGMKTVGEMDFVNYQDDRFDKNKGLQVIGSNQDELLKREEIVRKAEMMNPGDPNAGEKALNEYLMTQKTKLDKLNKDEDGLNLNLSLEIPKSEGSPRASDTGGLLELQRRRSDQFKEDVKKKLLEEAENNPNVDKGGLADLKKATKGKGWELLMHMGIGIATENNVAEGIKAGLKNAMEFEKAFGDDASDFQIVELGDGRLVRVNKKTGEVMDTGEKGKGSDKPAAIKTLEYKANALGIDVDDLIRFDLTKGDKSYEEQLLDVSKFILGNSMVPLEPEQAKDKAAELLKLIEQSSNKDLESLLQ